MKPKYGQDFETDGVCSRFETEVRSLLCLGSTLVTYLKGCEITDGYNCQTQNENLLSAVDLKVIKYGYNLKVYTFFHSE